MADRTDRWDSLNSISCVGTYLPRRCGIATFTADLAEALSTAAPRIETHTVAMNDRPEGYRYGPRVWFEINQHRPAEYRLAADFLNMSNVDAVSLQHEFGIFGGEGGNYATDFIRRLRMPVVATLHTVLPEPEPHYRRAAEQLIENCDRLVVMAERAFDFLTDIYKVPEEKIRLIHHGIPDVPFVDPNFYKDKFGVESNKVILTFGLLGPSKGLENMIDALPAIVAKHPDVVYIILGATHPGVVAHMGEEYRLGLQRRAKELGVDKHIKWFNRFVELDELVEFLGAADVYVTPYENEAQITSGTLAYALGTGKATVSTPYWYAQEMLADGRGTLVPFKRTDALAAAIIELFDNEPERHAMRKRAYQYTRQMRWQTVAEQYLDLLNEVRQERSRDPKPVIVQQRQLFNESHELPEIKLDHLAMMTDSCGALAHAASNVPDRRGGYTTDDNAAALRCVLLAHDHLGEKVGSRLDEMACNYLAFLNHSFDPHTGRFRHAMSYDRQWSEGPGSEDTHARALFALGECVARSHIRGHMTLAANLFHAALPACESFEHTHGIAHALIGIHAYLRRFSGDSHARRVREQLATRLLDQFNQHPEADWPWPDHELTYDAARLPHALLLSGRWMFNNEMIQTALKSLEWLYTIQTGDDQQFAPVGSDGWLVRGGAKARFDQLPDEACATIESSLEAYRVTNDSKWLDRAQLCLDWFLGNNDLRLPLYDQPTGGCFEKLMPQGVSDNQSTQATCAWMLSLLALYDHTLTSRHDAEAATGPTLNESEIGESPLGQPVITESGSKPPQPKRRKPRSKSGA